MKQRISKGSTGQVLVVTSLEFDEQGFVKDQKVASIAFDPNKDEDEMLNIAATYEWEIYGLKNMQGFQSIKKKRLLTKAELDNQILTGSGRTIVNSIVEEKLVKV